jgi:1,6-anhydro-N-acetylmuramate kinase
VLESKERGLKQTDIARTIGVHRSVIHRQLQGHEDITLSRVAELAYAMGRRVVIDFPEIKAPQGSNLAPTAPQVSRGDSSGDVTISTPPPRNDASNSFSRKVVHA